MFKVFSKFFIVLFLFSASCATVSCNQGSCGGADDVGSILPRTSFVKIEKIIEVKICDPTEPTDCFTKALLSSGSGFVVRNDNDGSYIFTAGHVCDDSDVIARFTAAGAQVTKQEFVVIDINKNRFKAKTIAFTMCEDMCVAYAAGFYRPPVKIAQLAPQQGDGALNLAAPLGVFDNEMIPILHGHYSGIAYKGKAIYTIPAIGGSSGSGIFNNRGELIGMIHSAHIRFPFLSLSPTHREIVNYILAHANRKALLKKLMND